MSKKLRWLAWIGQSQSHNFQNVTRDLIMKQHKYFVFTVTRWFCQSSIWTCFWNLFGLFFFKKNLFGLSQFLICLLVRMPINAIMSPSDVVCSEKLHWDVCPKINQDQSKHDATILKVFRVTICLCHYWFVWVHMVMRLFHWHVYPRATCEPACQWDMGVTCAETQPRGAVYPKYFLLTRFRLFFWYLEGTRFRLVW